MLFFMLDLLDAALKLTATNFLVSFQIQPLGAIHKWRRNIEQPTVT